MPIFHDPSESPPKRQVSRHSPSTASGRAWDLQSADHIPVQSDVEPTLNHTKDTVNSYLDRKPPMLDRADLIQQLKRANTPTWQHNATRQNHQNSGPASRDRPQTPVRSPIHIKSPRASSPDSLRDHAAAGLEIERPRSALHAGDFREKKQRTCREESSTSETPLATSPVVPWNQSFPAAARPLSRSETTVPFPEPQHYDFQPGTRARAISQLSFPSFAFMPPTSPLVQQSNNTDLDFSSRPGSRQTSPNSEKTNRRHTFSPNSFSAYEPTNMARSASSTLVNGHTRRGMIIPSQAHQPRRSITSFHPFSAHSNPQTSLPASRKSSVTSDASPLHHAPMVGSYEESILRGRMSTTPSRPLNFIAKIGVLGKGQCHSNLRCPPHIAIPFPAVFYSYNTGNGRISDDSPSPYVGLVDLENSLSPPDESRESSRRKRRQTTSSAGTEDNSSRADVEELGSQLRTKEDIRRREKKKRRSTSPKAPPGGSYRIPQVGQLQIVIKNPNKTAVKLFLVPYDLSDMEPGQKTFVRQRSYSAGPIIDMPLSSRTNLGTDRPEAALSNSDDPNDRPILRYLIHLNICCPSKGRYYLYKCIRVVFANRVPDGKEKLRNEVQLPEPRYSTYKATRDSLASQASSSTGAQLTAEKAMRRRSAGTSLSHRTYDQLDGLVPSHHLPFPPPAVEFTGGPSHSSSFHAPLNAIAPIPFNLSRTPITPPRPLSRAMDLDEQSPFLPRAMNFSPPSSLNLEGPYVSEGNGATAFEKRNVDAFSGTTSPGAGLLAKRLRSLDVQRQCTEDGAT